MKDDSYIHIYSERRREMAAFPFYGYIRKHSRYLDTSLLPLVLSVHVNVSSFFCPSRFTRPLVRSFVSRLQKKNV